MNSSNTNFTVLPNFTVLLFFSLGIPVALLLLEFVLSRAESAVPGLVLPGLHALFTVLSVLMMVQPVSTFTVVTTLLLYNIPTALYLAIYFAVRSKRRKQKQLEQMNLQDLD